MKDSYVILLTLVLHTLPLITCSHSVVLCDTTVAHSAVSSVEMSRSIRAPTTKKKKIRRFRPISAVHVAPRRMDVRSLCGASPALPQNKCTAHPAVSTLLGCEGNHVTMISVSKRWTASKAVLAAAWALVAAVAGVPTVHAMYSSSSDVVQASKRDDEEIR